MSAPPSASRARTGRTADAPDRPIGPRGPLALALVARNAKVARRQPLVFLSTFLEPILYLLSIGIGVGGLVGEIEGPGGRLTDYRSFVAPALLATSAMFGAVFDTIVTVFIKYKYLHTYDAVLATPLSPWDVVKGEALWGQARLALHATVYLVTMAVLGLILSPWAVLALPAALLIGYAFSGVGLLVATVLRAWTDFDYVIVAVMPMFLFSGVFFPLSQYPDWLAQVVRLTPLYQGVALERALVFGEIGPGLLVAVAYLLLLGWGTSRLAAARLRALLQP